MLKKGLGPNDAKCLEVQFKLTLKKVLDPNDAKCLEVKFNNVEESARPKRCLMS